MYAKKILFLTLTNLENIERRGIYTDLIREIASKGTEIYTVSPRQKRTVLGTEFKDYGKIKTLKVRTGNITKVNFFEKGISTLLIENQFLKAVNKYFKDINFDMIMYSTPPITFNKIVSKLKKRYRCGSYLILKDIFPQNAVDLRIIKKNSFLHRYFRNKEIRLYQLSDHIGCMSKANRDYILEHNPFIDQKKVEIMPNSIHPADLKHFKNVEKGNILKKYGIDKNKTLFLYGGNLGKPQGIDFLLKIIENFNSIRNSFLLIIGSGTEYGRIEKKISTGKLKNVKIINYLPKNEYDTVLSCADIGLIFLDPRFTIPNFPSRLTAYMEAGIPILASTDTATDIKEVLEGSGSGKWIESGDIEGFIEKASELSDDTQLRKSMGIKARNYLEENFDIKRTINVILDHLHSD